VEGNGERRENSNGSVLVLESYLIVLEVAAFGVASGIGEGISESELLDEKVIRLRLDVDEAESRLKKNDLTYEIKSIEFYVLFSWMTIVQVFVYDLVVVNNVQSIALISSHRLPKEHNQFQIDV
jgi:hypothetical protein